MSESASPEHGTFLMHRNRGREHFEAAEYGLARRDLELARSIRDDDADLMYWLGMAYFQLDQHAEAEDLFRQLIKIRPGHASLHVNRGIALFKLKRVEEAEPEFRRALELDGAGKRPHLYLGLTHSRRDECEAALRHFEEAGASMLASQMRQRLGLPAGQKRPAPRAPEPEVELEIVLPPPATLEHLNPVLSSIAEPGQPPAGEPPMAADSRTVVAPPEDRPLEVAESVQAPVLQSSPVAVEDSPRVVHEAGGGPEAAEVTVHGGTLLRMNFQGTALAHRDALVGSAGGLSFGRSTLHEELVRVMGEGTLYLVREDRRISVVPLRGDAFHVVMERFVASQNDLAREVSTSVEEGALPLRALGLGGNGMVGLSTVGRPLVLEVRPGRPATLSAQRVVGWMGALQVSRASDDPVAIATGSPMLRFEGGGKVILDVPEGATAGPDADGADPA
jgi:Flp pilus assembly protein TadD/uncharacterized protein (AIM24 family)